MDLTQFGLLVINVVQDAFQRWLGVLPATFTHTNEPTRLLIWGLGLFAVAAVLKRARAQVRAPQPQEPRSPERVAPKLAPAR